MYTKCFSSPKKPNTLLVHNLDFFQNFKFPEDIPDESGNVLSTDLNYLKYLVIYFLSAKSDVKI